MQEWDALRIPFPQHPPSYSPDPPFPAAPQHHGGGLLSPHSPWHPGVLAQPPPHPPGLVYGAAGPGSGGRMRRQSCGLGNFFNRKALLTWSIFSIRVIIAVFFISADFHTAPSMCVKSHRANNKVFKIS